MFSNFKARASKIGSWSAVWLVPLVALLIGVWLIYDYYSSRGRKSSSIRRRLTASRQARP